MKRLGSMYMADGIICEADSTVACHTGRGCVFEKRDSKGANPVFGLRLPFDGGVTDLGLAASSREVAQAVLVELLSSLCLLPADWPCLPVVQGHGDDLSLFWDRERDEVFSLDRNQRKEVVELHRTALSRVQAILQLVKQGEPAMIVHQ